MYKAVVILLFLIMFEEKKNCVELNLFEFYMGLFYIMY